MVDRKFSLAVELKDDTKDNSYESIGLGVYSNSKSTVLSYVSIFESLWNQSELFEKLKIHEKMQRDFINIAAHELRNPIQPILGLTDVVRFKEEDPQQRKFLNIVIRNAKKLKRLTEDILDVTKIESNSLELNKEMINLTEIIENVLEDYREEVQKPDLKIMYVQEKLPNYRQPYHDHYVVMADKSRVSQVISNLIGNATKFTREGSVFVSLKEEHNDDADGYVIIIVRDTGSGIDPDILPRLFTKFAATSNGGGTGLGLYISKTIVEAHGGKIWTENNANGSKGATFSFSLPLSRNS
jgi:two-component system sensor histidine kinase VicK